MEEAIYNYSLCYLCMGHFSIYIYSSVNQCLKEEALAMRGMLIKMGFPQVAKITEKDNQVCEHASEIPNLSRGMRYLDLTGLLIKKKDESKVIKLFKVAFAEKTSDLRINRLALLLFDELVSHIVDTSLKVNLQKWKLKINLLHNPYLNYKNNNHFVHGKGTHCCTSARML